jgi:hypothetical protein
VKGSVSDGWNGKGHDTHIHEIWELGRLDGIIVGDVPCSFLGAGGLGGDNWRLVTMKLVLARECHRLGSVVRPPRV